MGLADDCESILRALLEKGPMTRDEIRTATGLSHHWAEKALSACVQAGQAAVVPHEGRGRKRVSTFAIREPKP